MVRKRIYLPLAVDQQLSTVGVVAAMNDLGLNTRTPTNAGIAGVYPCFVLRLRHIAGPTRNSSKWFATTSPPAVLRVLAIRTVLLLGSLPGLWRQVRNGSLLPVSIVDTESNFKQHCYKEIRCMIISIRCRFWLLAAVFICLASTMALAQKHSVRINKEMAELLEGKKYAEVESLVLKSGEADPFFLAWLKLKQGKEQEGLDMLKQQVSEATGDRVESILRSLALLSDISTKDAISLDKFYLKSESFRDNPRLKLYLSGLYLKQKEVKPAMTLVNEVLKTSFSGSDLKKWVFNLIIYFYENGQNDDAMVYFDKLMTKVPETKLDPGNQLLWARIAAAAGKPLEALKKIDGIQSSFPNYYETKKGLFYLSRGIAYEKLGDRKQAKKEWLAVVELAKEDPKFQGMAPMAKDKLAEYKQDEETVKKMRQAAIDAEVPTDAESNQIRSDASSTRRLAIITTCVLIVICVIAISVKRFKK